MQNRMSLFIIVLGAFLLWQCSEAPQRAALHYPATKKVDHVDTYFGVDVADPYRWLEDDTSTAVAEWVKAQNDVSFGYLRALPKREEFKQRLKDIRNYERFSAPTRRGDLLVYSRNDGLQNQNVIYAQNGIDGEPFVLLDPNSFSEDGSVYLRQTSLSRDGKYMAYSISRGGSDWNEIYVLEVETRKLLDDHIRWVKFSGIYWDNDGFYYSGYDAPANEATKLSAQNSYHKAFYHKVGTGQEQDVLVYGNPDHPDRLHYAGPSEDDKYVFMFARSSRYKGVAAYFKPKHDPTAGFIAISESFEYNNWVVDHVGGRIIMHTDRDAPRNRIVSIDPQNPAPEQWETIIPENEDVITSIESAGGRLFVTYLKDVSSRVFVYDYSGTLEREIELPGLGSVSGFSGQPGDDFVFYTYTSFTEPHTIYRYDIATGESTVFRAPELDFDLESCETKQVFYTSKDGTRVPMFIVHRKGLELNGQNPTLLSAYGGFGRSVYPRFSSGRLPFIENGGIFVLANIRGGGEYGEQWHMAAMRMQRQNAFDDFIAAAEYLIEQQYTSPDKLAIRGGSNGGLLVGVVMNQRPDLFAAAIPEVGVMDMLRFHKFTIGRMWTREYGSSEDSSDFRYLYGYSPLHNIRAGVDYPATLVITADHDDRVVPAHSFKYIATLQERYQGPNPVLIRIDTKGGHGGGGQDKYIEQQSDVLAFLFAQLGMEAPASRTLLSGAGNVFPVRKLNDRTCRNRMRENDYQSSTLSRP